MPCARHSRAVVHAMPELQSQSQSDPCQRHRAMPWANCRARVTHATPCHVISIAQLGVGIVVASALRGLEWASEQAFKRSTHDISAKKHSKKHSTKHSLCKEAFKEALQRSTQRITLSAKKHSKKHCKETLKEVCNAFSAMNHSREQSRS